MNTLLFLGDVSGMELFLIALVVLIFFGTKQIPEIARGLGKGMNEIKQATNGIKNEIEKSVKEIENDIHKNV